MHYSGLQSFMQFLVCLCNTPLPSTHPNPSECQNRDQTGPNFKALAFKRAAQSVQDSPLIISSGRDAETLKWVVSTSIYNSEPNQERVKYLFLPTKLTKHVQTCRVRTLRAAYRASWVLVAPYNMLSILDVLTCACTHPCVCVFVIRAAGII